MVCERVLKEGVSKMVCDKVPHLPRKWQLDVSKCHTCHAKRRWMLPSATPATQMAGGCRRVPHLPRKVARHHRATTPVQARHQTLPSVSSATPATQMAVGCLQCHTCHANGSWMSPSAAPATQMAGGCRRVSRLPRKVNEGGCYQVPRLPRETKVDVAKCRAGHAKCRGVTVRPIRSKRTARPCPVSPVPHLPRKWHFSKCHACHTNGRWMSPSATPATQSAAASPRDQSGPSAPLDPAQWHKCHAYHAKRRWMLPSATPAT